MQLAIQITILFLFFLTQTAHADMFEYTFKNNMKVVISVKGALENPEAPQESYFETSYGERKVISNETLDAVLLPLNTQLIENESELPKGIHFIQTNNDSQMNESDFLFLVKRNSSGFNFTLINLSGRVFELNLPSKIAVLKSETNHDFHHTFEELVKEISLSEVFTFKGEKIILLSLKTTLGEYTFVARDLTVHHPD
ncbi:MAG TPA: hypothetical protein PLJ21_10425, partial [Pseudobdellovibrionaceae bacterium]|nr:hypothetical protein [Pseudobdellovibrionaceae bacterium]